MVPCHVSSADERGTPPARERSAYAQNGARIYKHGAVSIPVSTCLQFTLPP